jgi:hypothetical protein
LAGDVPRLRPIDVVQYGLNMIDLRMQVQIFDIAVEEIRCALINDSPLSEGSSND